MKNEVLFKDLKVIYYSLQTTFSPKIADKVMTRLIKKLKKSNAI